MATWAARIAGSLCLLMIAVIVGLLGWSQTIALSDPTLALSIYPRQVRGLLSYAEQLRLSEKDHRIDFDQVPPMLMQRAPLLDAPRVYMGLQFAARGEAASARSSFLSAIERQPRNVLALSWLAADAIAAGKSSTAAAYLERLAALNADEGALYAEILGSVVGQEGGVQLLEERLQAGAPLAQSALHWLNGTSSDMPMLMRLNAHSLNGQSQLVARLFSEQGAMPAFIAWLAFQPELEASSISWPLDPVFVGVGAPLPFNWEFFEGAEPLEQGGLHISYSGREQPVFARQIVVLTAGSYVFSSEMESDAPANGAMFDWVIQCYPSQQKLGVAAVVDLSAGSVHEIGFDVPPGAGCEAQRLLLQGRPGQVPGRVRATIQRVSIHLAGMPK